MYDDISCHLLGCLLFSGCLQMCCKHPRRRFGHGTEYSADNLLHFSPITQVKFCMYWKKITIDSSNQGLF